MPLHFEELWEKCEQFHQSTNANVELNAIIEALSLKLNLYQAIQHEDMPQEEAQQAKTRVMGEILITLTQLSLKDNINVFDALQIALHYHNVEWLGNKHQ